MAKQISLGVKQKKNSIQPTDQAMTNQKLRIWAWCNYTLTHFLPDCLALSYLEGLECNMLTNMNTKIVQYQYHIEQNLSTVFMCCSVNSSFKITVLN